MLTFATTQRIYLARAVVDMRKSFDSLTSLVRNQLGKDPFTGDAFVFVGKGRDRVKILVWDVSGFWVCAKRLEKGRFRWPATTGPERSVVLRAEELAMLLNGLDLKQAQPRRGWYRRAS